MIHQAAQHLEVRETDFRYLLAADLIAPKTYTAVQVSRYRWVDVPLYRVGDLDALREHPDIDWEAVHAVKPGELSPVRHLARRPVDRAAVIRRGIAELGDRYRAEVWAWWNNNAGIWEVDFERLDGGPTVEEFTAAIAQHPSLRDHHQAIAVATEAGAALRWARAMRTPGAAVILDTETTDLDGYVVEVAVLDAATGAVLLDTLVNPGCPVQPAARWVHGIDDDQLAGAPPLAEVLAPPARGHRRAHGARVQRRIRPGHGSPACPPGRSGPGASGRRAPLVMPDEPPLGLADAPALATARRRPPRPRGLRGGLRAAGRNDRPGLPTQGAAAMSCWPCPEQQVSY